MHDELVKLGLSQNEAKVYLALLSIGPVSAGKIATHANIKRPTTYLALERLVELGLAAEVTGNKEKLFKPEEPEKLSKLTKKLRRQAIAAELKLDELMPGLKAIQKSIVEPPKVKSYQGISGIKNILEEVSESRNSWYYFGASEE